MGHVAFSFAGGSPKTPLRSDLFSCFYADRVFHCNLYPPVFFCTQGMGKVAGNLCNSSLLTLPRCFSSKLFAPDRNALCVLRYVLTQFSFARTAHQEVKCRSPRRHVSDACLCDANGRLGVNTILCIRIARRSKNDGLFFVVRIDLSRLIDGNKLLEYGRPSSVVVDG